MQEGFYSGVVCQLISYISNTIVTTFVYIYHLIGFENYYNVLKLREGSLHLLSIILCIIKLYIIIHIVCESNIYMYNHIYKVYLNI